MPRRFVDSFALPVGPNTVYRHVQTYILLKYEVRTNDGRLIRHHYVRVPLTVFFQSILN